MLIASRTSGSPLCAAADTTMEETTEALNNSIGNMSIEEAPEQEASAAARNSSFNPSPRRVLDNTPRSRRRQQLQLTQTVRRLMLTPPARHCQREAIREANRLRHQQQRAELEEAESEAIRERDRIAQAERRDRLSQEERDREREEEEEAGLDQPRAPPIQPHRNYMRARCNRTPLLGEVAFEELEIELCDIDELGLPGLWSKEFST